MTDLPTRLLVEELAELRRDNARLHVLLAEHHIADPTPANLTARQRRILAEADAQDAEPQEQP